MKLTDLNFTVEFDYDSDNQVWLAELMGINGRTTTGYSAVGVTPSQALESIISEVDGIMKRGHQ